MSLDANVLYILNSAMRYAGNALNWPENSYIWHMFRNVPKFQSFEELELNLVLAGSFDAKPFYEVDLEYIGKVSRDTERFIVK